MTIRGRKDGHQGGHHTGPTPGVSGQPADRRASHAKDGATARRLITQSDASSSSGGSRRQSKRPRQPGDVPSMPAPVKEEERKASSSLSELASQRRRLPAGGDLAVGSER